MKKLSRRHFPRYLLRLFTGLIFCSILAPGCVRRREQSPPSVGKILPAAGLEVSSDKTHISIFCQWENDDSKERLIVLLTPPRANLRPVLLDYNLMLWDKSEEPTILTRKEAEDKFGEIINDNILKNILVSPEGFLRFHYIQSIRLNPAINMMALPVVFSNVPGEAAQYPRLKSIALQLQFDDTSALPSLHGAAKENRPQDFQPILDALVDNPEMAHAYRLRAAEISIPTTNTLPQSVQQAKGLRASTMTPLVLINKEPGVCKIDRALLSKSGINAADMNPRYFHLRCAGRDIPLFSWGCLTERFQENDALLFYAYPVESEYTDANVFVLTYEPDAEGLRMETIGADDIPNAQSPEYFISKTTIEEDTECKIHSGNFLSIKGMRWIWQEFSADEPFEAVFNLPGYAEQPGKGNGTLKIYCQPDSWETPAELEMQINDAPSQRFSITGPQDNTKQFEYDFAALRERGNKLSIRMRPLASSMSLSSLTTETLAPPTPAGLYMDNLALEYPRQYLMEKGELKFEKAPDSLPAQYTIGNVPPRAIVAMDYSDCYRPRFIITKKTIPGKLTFSLGSQPASCLLTIFDFVRHPDETRFLLNENLHAPNQAADYLIIAHPDFIPAAKRLAIHREKKSRMKVKIVDVRAIYDEFSHGIQSPVPIKQFLASTLVSWKIPPAYVLFIGDATSDYKHEARNDIINYVPAYSHISRMGDQDKWASEHWFTTLIGEDEYPDILLGRISVNNLADAENVVNKIIHYETKPSLGEWRATLGLVADDGPFDKEAETLRKEFTPAAFSAKTVYLEYLPLEDNFYLDQAFVERTKAKISTVATAKIFDLFQNGAVYLSFFGHGSPNIWADERIWFGGDTINSDNIRLTNKNHLTFVANMTCNSGAIDYPVPKWNIAISEDMLRQPSGGAIGLFVPSGPGFSSGHMKLSAALHEAFFEKRVRRMGDATALARSLYLLRKNQVEIMQMFILLGDPALALQIPRGDVSLSADKKIISSKELPATIKITAAIASPQKGKAILQLWPPANEPSQTLPIVDYTKGVYESFLELPENSAAGEWTARCYAFNEKTGQDAVGAVSIIVGDPCLSLQNPRPEKALKEIRLGEPLKISVELKNNTPVPCADARVELLNLTQPSNPPQTFSRGIPANASRTLAADVIPHAGLNIYKFQLMNYYQNPAPDVSVQSSEIIAVAALDDSQTSPDLCISEMLMKRSFAQNGESVTMNLNLPVYNLGTMPLDYANLVLCSGATTEGVVLRSLRLPPMAALLPNPATLTFNFQDASTRQMFTLKALPPQGISDVNPDNNYFTFEYNPEDLCDLVIQSETITLSEEKPTEGKTVFFDVPVTNQGKSPAEHFRVCLFDNDPAQGGRPLFDYTGKPEREVSHLKPQTTKIVRLRWDPIKNSGKNIIFVKADSSELLAESNENNNTASVEIYVRTKAKLITDGIEIRQTEKEKEDLIAHLVAKVRNEGETEAKNVCVRFFKSKIQTPETTIGETLYPRIEPGETAEIDFIWQLKEEEAKFTYRPSFQVFLKGSSQRFSSVETDKP